jgi:serine/threonine protein kinase
MEQNFTQLFCALAARSAKIDASEFAARVASFSDASEPEFIRRVADAGLLPEDEARSLFEIAGALIEAGADGSADGETSGVAVRVFHGRTLRESLRKTVSLSERLNLLPYVIDACRAVGAAHGRGVMHRGIRPEVIVISEFGECVVRDWSLSKVRRKEDVNAGRVENALELLRQRKPSALDIAFISPELAMGHMESVDARSDVYSLGAVLYEILAGQPPFPNHQALSEIASKRPESVSVLEPTAPTGLVAICERAMHQEPSARYASAKHLSEDIERCVMSMPKPHADASNGGVGGVGSKSRIALAVSIALLVLVTCVAALSQRRVISERDNFATEARELRSQFNALTEERDKIAKELEETSNVRHDAETERDKAEADLKAAQEKINQQQELLKKAQTPPPPPIPSAPTAEAAPEAASEAASEATPAPEAVEEPAHQQTEEPSAAPEPLRAPEPPSKNPAKAGAPANLPSKFLGANSGNVKSDGSQRPPGVTRAEFVKLLPELVGALSADKGPDGKTAVAVGVAGKDLSSGLQDLGFKGGDVITNINRSAVGDMGQAKQLLEGAKNDNGFNVRLVRDGQSSWMRVNVFEKMPEMPRSASTPPVPEHPGSKPPQHKDVEPPPPPPSQNEGAQEQESSSQDNKPTEDAAPAEAPVSDDASAEPAPSDQPPPDEMQAPPDGAAVDNAPAEDAAPAEGDSSADSGSSKKVTRVQKSVTSQKK